jgi:DNA-binding transcriptional regulator YhcF (GntR family)
MSVQPDTDAALYDWANADMEEGDPLVEAARTGYGRVMEHLRELLFTSEKGKRVAPGSALPGQMRLSAELGVDVTIVNRAFAAFAAEGFIRQAGRGKATIVEYRWPYVVTIHVPLVAEDAIEELNTALSEATAADPVIASCNLSPRSLGAWRAQLQVEMTIEMPDAAWAVTRAGVVIRTACAGRWDLAAASFKAVRA